MARTVTDVALLLDVMSEPDARDWAALPPPARSFLDGLDGGVRGLAVGFSADLGHATVDPEVAAAVAAAARAFEALGATVEAADPAIGDTGDALDVLWQWGAGGAVDGMGGAHDPGLREVAARGRDYTVLEYLAATRRRDAIGTAMGRFHERFDLLLTPTLPLPAFAAGREVPQGSADPRWPSWTPFSYPFNLTQQPAAAVPCGFTAGGLPIGLQIVGPRHADALVLRAARAYEAAYPQPTLAP